MRVTHSQGFDIDFDHFRCVFNYHRAYLDDGEFGDFGDEPETTEDFLKRLSHKSLEDYNLNEVKYFQIRFSKMFMNVFCVFKTEHRCAYCL